MTATGVPLGATFTDFRVNCVAVCSFSDAGQSPPEFAGSVLAHGVVDNFTVITPPPPIQDLTGGFSNNVWHVQFLSRTNWIYILERTADFQSWTDASPPTPGSGTNLVLPDAAAPTDKAFYRVRANRP